LGGLLGTGTLLVGALYLSSVLVHDMSSGNPDVTDRWCRGLQRPWDSAGRHVYILNKPEQLRGPLSPHRKAGTQNRETGFSGPSVMACVPLSTPGRLCVLDSQDSCCPSPTRAGATGQARLDWARRSPPETAEPVPSRGVSAVSPRTLVN